MQHDRRVNTPDEPADNPNRSTPIAASLPSSTNLIAPRLADLVAAVAEPWESIRQTVEKRSDCPLGDPHVPPSPAFHLRHTNETFRLHARKVLAAIRADPDTVGIPSPDDPVPLKLPWSPTAAAQELDTHARAFAAELANQPAELLANTTIEHGHRFTLPDFIAMMTRHIVWHAAAAYYRASTPSPAPTDEPN